VQQPGVAQLPDLLAGEAYALVGAVTGAVHHRGEAHRHVGDTARVPERGGVALLDRVHRRLHEPFEQALDLLVQAAVLDGDRGLAGKRGDELHGALRVRHHLTFDVGRGRQHGLGTALAVDQLQDTDHILLVILHGDDEHRLGAVAVPLVEGAIDAVLHVGRQEVRIVDHERLAGHRGVAREARAVDGNGELDERRLGLGIGLRQSEAQALLTLIARFDEVEAAGVGGSDAAGLREDQVEQGLHVALGAERDADTGELADFAAAARGLAPGPGRLQPGGGLAIPCPHRHQQLPRADGLAHESRQQLGRHLRRNVRLAIATEGYDRAARVDEGAQHVEWKHGAALGVEHEHARPLVHGQVAR